MAKRATLWLAAAATTLALPSSPSSIGAPPRRRRRDLLPSVRSVRSVRSVESSSSAFSFFASSSSLRRPVRCFRPVAAAARPPPRTFVFPTTALLAAAVPRDDDGDDDRTPPPPASAAAGPKGEPSAHRRTRRSPSSPRRSPPRRTTTTSSRPATSDEAPRPRRRAPHQYDHTKSDARPFVNAKTEIGTHVCNEDAPTFDDASPSNGDDDDDLVVRTPHFETRSLDELFPAAEGFSESFCTDATFRNGLRDAMRRDVFDTTEVYANMSDKARRMLLLPDSSLQGSWKCDGGNWNRGKRGEEGETSGDKKSEGPEGASPQRMMRLTKVLKDRLGRAAPTGDEFMDRIGSLCGSDPSTHWIDIVGVSDRRIAHSWHQDTGRSGNDGNGKTVLLGFPAEDDYEGPGVFSHLVKLKRERRAPVGHPPNEPIVYPGTIDDEHVVRPNFAMGREIILYRDVDVLHSSPDVAYRASVMRFM